MRCLRALRVWITEEKLANHQKAAERGTSASAATSSTRKSGGRSIAVEGLLSEGENQASRSGAAAALPRLLRVDEVRCRRSEGVVVQDHRNIIKPDDPELCTGFSSGLLKSLHEPKRH